MFTLFFTGEEVTDFASASRSDTERFARFFQGMLTEGISLAPAQFEADFTSFAHSDEDIRLTIGAIERVFAGLKG